MKTLFVFAAFSALLSLPLHVRGAVIDETASENTSWTQYNTSPVSNNASLFSTLEDVSLMEISFLPYENHHSMLRMLKSVKKKTKKKSKNSSTTAFEIASNHGLVLERGRRGLKAGKTNKKLGKRVKTNPPTNQPTNKPTKATKKTKNTKVPSTPPPTSNPTSPPTSNPSAAPSAAPSLAPSESPTETPIVEVDFLICSSQCESAASLLATTAELVLQLKLAAIEGTDLTIDDIVVDVEVSEASCSGSCGTRRLDDGGDGGGGAFLVQINTKTEGGGVQWYTKESMRGCESTISETLEENNVPAESISHIRITKPPTHNPTPRPTPRPTVTFAPTNSTSRLLQRLEVAHEDVEKDIFVDPVAKKQIESPQLQDLTYTKKSFEKTRIFEEDFVLPVYWVNLDRSVERRVIMEEMFTNLTSLGHPLRPERVSAKNIKFLEDLLEEGRFVPNGFEIVPTDEEESWLKHQRKQYPTVEIACLLSHLYAVLQSFLNGDEVCLILEDDAILKDEFLSDWQEYAKLAPIDWKILQWATSNDATLKHTTHYDNDPWITWQPEYYCAAGYMLTRDGMEQVLKQSLKQTEDGVFFWNITEPELIVADELVYYLAGAAYSSTFPWITTSGLASTFGESHGLFETEEFTYEQKKVLKRQDSILILMSCRLADEVQIAGEIDRLKTDLSTFSMWNSNFRWIVNVVIAEEYLVPIFEEQMASIQTEDIEIRSRVDPEPFNKFELVADFIDEMKQFDYVLIKDNDMRLSGFAWNSFMEKKGDAVVTGALHQSVEESLARNLGKPKRQYYEFNEGQMWKYLNVPEYTNLTPLPTLFVEMGFALLDGDFAGWFFNQVLDTHFISQRSDWGIDKMWCGAAKAFRPESPSCVLVPIPVTHDDSRQLIVDESNEAIGMKAFAHFRENPLFRDWIDAMAPWEEFIGSKSTLQVVTERCRAMLYSGKKVDFDLSRCAELIVEDGGAYIPGNLYTCGWDMLGLNIFPDYTYRGVYQKDFVHYTEKDIIISDLHTACVPTGDYQKSMLYMAENFPGRVLYVNGESHGNIEDYPEDNVGFKATQLGTYDNDEYTHTVHVYIVAMAFFALDPETWDWMFDPAKRQMNNGKNHAVAYIVSNCKEFRQNAAKELSKIVEVQYGGKCSVDSENARRVEAEHHHWTENYKLYNDYKYCLVMENGQIDGYITEKILMAFLGGCMPIWWGTKEVFDIFNEDAFIFYDIENPEPALEKMRLFEKDPEAYNKAMTVPILKNGSDTVKKYFSLSDEIAGNSEIKTKIRETMGIHNMHS